MESTWSSDKHVRLLCSANGGYAQKYYLNVILLVQFNNMKSGGLVKMQRYGEKYSSY